MEARIDWKTVEEAIKDLGSREELLHCATVGRKAKLLRKKYNMDNQALLRAAKKDPRYRNGVLHSTEQKVRTA